MEFKLNCNNITTKNFSAAIFDFDGVVVDTEKYHLASWNKAFAPFGAIIEEKQYPPLKSTGKSNIIGFAERKAGRTFTEEQKAEIYANKIAYFKSMANGITEADIISGVIDFLQALKTRNIKTAVASSASSTTAFIQKFKLNNLFDAVIDGNAAYKKKPAPDIFLAAADRINESPENCIVFEDAPAGIAAAIAANMSVIAVGLQSENALFSIPDFICLTVGE